MSIIIKAEVFTLQTGLFRFGSGRRHWAGRRLELPEPAKKREEEEAKQGGRRRAQRTKRR